MKISCHGVRVFLCVCAATCLAAPEVARGRDGEAPSVGTFDQAGTALQIVQGSEKIHPNGLIESAQLARDTTIDEVPVSGRPSYAGFYCSGKLRWGVLATEHVIDGIRLQAGQPFELFEEEGLRFGHLAVEQELQGIALPAGTSFYRHEKGYVRHAYVPGEIQIHGVWIGGQERDKQEIHFHQEEPVLSADTSRDQEIHGVLVPAGSHVYFDARGRLRALAPIRPVRIHDLEFMREVLFDEDGKLAEGWLSKQQEIDGVAYLHGWQPVFFYPNGKVKSGYLSSEQTIQGVRARAQSSVRFHPNGRLASVLLAGEQRIQGMTLANSGRLAPGCDVDRPDVPIQGPEWYPSGNIEVGYLAMSQEVRGIVFRGGTQEDRSQCVHGSTIELFDNGRVKSGYLAADQTIDNIPLQACRRIGDECRLQFHPSGKLKTGHLAGDVRLRRVLFKANSRIRLHPNGRVAFGYLARHQTVSGLHLPAGLPVRFTPAGRLANRPEPKPWPVGGTELSRGTILFDDHVGRVRSARLARYMRLFGVRLKSGTHLLFDQQEQISGYVLMRPQGVRGIDFPRYSRLYFNPKGRIDRALLGISQLIHGIPCAAEHWIGFHDSGRLARARLSADHVVGSRSFSKGEIIELYADGRPLRGTLEKDEKIGGVQLRAGDRIENHFEDGKLELVAFGSDRLVQGIPCRRGMETWFHDNGKLRKCWLSRPARLQDLPVRDRVELHPSGSLKQTFLAEPRKIRGIEFADDAITLYPTGEVMSGRLARTQAIKGEIYEGLTLIHLDRSGEILSAEPFAPPPDL